MSNLFMRRDMILAVLVIAIVALLIIPLPQLLIDVIIGFNMTLALILMMVAIYIKSPTQFPTFPSIILIGTTLRIAISVATTRMILAEADAGEIIRTFGEFVVAGSVGVGLVVFLIICCAQFIVVTKGAERVAEVAARFALDGLPGKQLSIDADIRSGAITQEQGRMRRQQLDKESQYLGAMDGAMKFVKGDAIASLIIVAVNLAGGIAIGTLSRGLPIGEAVSIYSLLTVGDGLVAQIPSLLMALCAGTIVTRVTGSDQGDLGSEIASDLGRDRRAIMVAAPFVIAVGFIPGFPFLVFAGIGGGLLLIGIFLGRVAKRKAEETATPASQFASGASITADGSSQSTLPGGTVTETSRIVVRVASNLMDLDDLETAKDLRNQLFERLMYRCGIQFPQFTILRDDDLADGMVSIEVDEVPTWSGRIPQGAVLAMCEPDVAELATAEILGSTDLKWPGEKGIWCKREDAEALRAVTTIASVGEALTEAAFRTHQRHIDTFITKSEALQIMENAKVTEPELIAQVQDQVPLNVFMEVLKRLIREGVPLRPASLLLNALVDNSALSNPVDLAERARKKLRRQICHLLAGSAGTIPAIMLELPLEQSIRKAFKSSERDKQDTSPAFTMDPIVVGMIVEQLGELQFDRHNTTASPTIVTSPDVRIAVREVIARYDMPFAVVAYDELTPDISVQPIKMLRYKESAKPAPISTAA